MNGATVRELVQGILSEKHVASPGLIEAYDGEKMQARVKLKWKDERGNEPVIEDAPVSVLRAGGLQIIPPYEEGDKVLCVFSDPDLESTLSDESSREPIRVTQNELDYCIVIGGLFLDNETVDMAGDKSALRIGDEGGNGVLQVDDSGQIKLLSEDSVQVQSDNIELGSGTLKKLVTEAFKQVFNSHTHPASSGSTGPPSVQLTEAQMTQNTEAS